jgi:hypothetical protein
VRFGFRAGLHEHGKQPIPVRAPGQVPTAVPPAHRGVASQEQPEGGRGVGSNERRINGASGVIDVPGGRSEVAFKRDLGLLLTPTAPTAEAALIEARRFGMARGR